MADLPVFFFTALVTILTSILLGPLFISLICRTLGWQLRRKTQQRREVILKKVAEEKKEFDADESGNNAKSSSDSFEQRNKDWKGVIGFFHPFCNAGGGGERVLWAAILATQQRWPEATCVVYTGDHDVNRPEMLQRVQDRFNIHLNPRTIIFLYLSTRRYILASTWPRFTLLGQSLGSLVLAYDAFSLLIPDVFIDTMGYAFALALCKAFFPGVPTGAYVHYPTISTDMLGSLEEGGQGLNAGLGVGWRGKAKKTYWRLFARLYGWVGGGVDVVMTNSSWTQGHIQQLWGPHRRRRKKEHSIEVVFPPCPVEELEREIRVDDESERTREQILLCIAQFRPEKNHALLLRAFAEFLKNRPQAPVAQQQQHQHPKLVLVGSVRDNEDSLLVYRLRLLAHDLHIKEHVEFVCNAPWSQVLEWERRASIGLNGMWNEHFGIGVVEYQAAGLMSIVHDSGGPKLDIVTECEGGPTGFHARTAAEFAQCFEKALALDPGEALAMRRRARKSAQRFTERAFAERWSRNLDTLIELRVRKGRVG